MPTEANLRDQYADFAELEAACAMFCEQVNTRTHRATGRPPVEMLAEEAARLHTLPATAVTTAFGETRRVGWDATISVGGVRYSVPHELVDSRVWTRFAGDELVVTLVDPDTGPREVARHQRGRRGCPQIRDEHYPGGHPSRRSVPGDRVPRASSAAEEAFLAIGPGAAEWLREAAATGAARMRTKMAEAVSLAKLHSLAAVDQALGAAALAGRFGDEDLPMILAHQLHHPPTTPAARASETHSLQAGTRAWATFGVASSGVASTGVASSPSKVVSS